MNLIVRHVSQSFSVYKLRIYPCCRARKNGWVKKQTFVMFLAERRALVVMEADMIKVYEKNCSN